MAERKRELENISLDVEIYEIGDENKRYGYTLDVDSDEFRDQNHFGFSSKGKAVDSLIQESEKVIKKIEAQIESLDLER